MSKSRLCLLVAWNNSQTLLPWKHYRQTCGTTTEHAPPRISLQILSLRLERSGNSLEGKEQEANYSFQGWNLQILKCLFFLAELLFLNSHWCPTANKAAAEGDLLLQWSWLHTVSNLHNLPHYLNQLKCTPGDYIQKPIWKNIHSGTEKVQGTGSKVAEAAAQEKKEAKKNIRKKDLAFTFVSIF